MLRGWLAFGKGVHVHLASARVSPHNRRVWLARLGYGARGSRSVGRVLVWVPWSRPVEAVLPAPCPLLPAPCSLSLAADTHTRAHRRARTLHAGIHPGGRAHTHARSYAVPPARHGRWAFGIPVPMALMLTADGHTEAHAEGTGWKVNVEVVAPLAGLLVKYQGDVYDAS